MTPHLCSLWTTSDTLTMGSTSAQLLMDLLALAVELLSLLQVGSLIVIANQDFNSHLTAAASSYSDGTLMLTNQPSNNEPTAFFDKNSLPNDNRTGIASGTDTPTGDSTSDPLLTCTAGHHGDHLAKYSPPSVVWVRNGQVVDDTDSRITLTSTNMTNGQVTSSLSITQFTAGDAGVYQCVFTDDSDGGDTEVITSIPYRLDTGSTLLYNSFAVCLYIQYKRHLCTKNVSNRICG